MFSLRPRARTTAKLLPSIQARTVIQPGLGQVFPAPDRPTAPLTRTPYPHAPSAIPVPPNTPTSSAVGSSTVTNTPKDVPLSQPRTMPQGTNARAQQQTAKKSRLEKLDEEAARRLDEHVGGVFGVAWKKTPEELAVGLKRLEEEVRATEKQMNVQRR